LPLSTTPPPHRAVQKGTFCLCKPALDIQRACTYCATMRLYTCTYVRSTYVRTCTRVPWYCHIAIRALYAISIVHPMAIRILPYHQQARSVGISAPTGYASRPLSCRYPDRNREQRTTTTETPTHAGAASVASSLGARLGCTLASPLQPPPPPPQLSIRQLKETVENHRNVILQLVENCEMWPLGGGSIWRKKSGRVQRRFEPMVENRGNGSTIPNIYMVRTMVLEYCTYVRTYLYTCTNISAGRLKNLGRPNG
jgi:hypothetical protein